MRILLVVKSKIMENLGVMYLSSVVKQCGSECKIIDIDGLIDMCKQWEPDMVGYSIMTGDEHRFYGANRAMIANIPVNKNIPIIVVGGPDPTFHPENYDWVDKIVKGEAENWMVDYLNGKENYATLDDIPWPNRTDFPNMPMRDFIASRGCPYDCKYCYNKKWNELFPGSKKVRYRDAQDVVMEVASTHPKFAYFQDSCFGVDIKWLREFSGLMAPENIPYHCHLRPEQVTEERVLLLKDSHCYSTRIALESASNRLRKLVGRGRCKLSDVEMATKLLKKWDIKLMIQNIIGLPTSTIEEDLETLEFNIRCKPAYGWVSIFQPYPGTALGDMCKNEGWYDGDYSDIADSFFDTSPLNFDEEHIEQLEILQKVFAPCVETGYMPKVDELTSENFPKLIHKIFRWQGDKRLYGGVI